EHVDHSCGMKAEDRARRHANAAVREDAQSQRAGGKARPVDHHALTRLAHRLKESEERRRLAARAPLDHDVRTSGREAGKHEEDGEKGASHRTSKSFRYDF